MWDHIRTTLRMPCETIVSRASIYRSNLKLEVKVRSEGTRQGGAIVQELEPLVQSLLAESLTDEGPQPTIVYTHMIRHSEKIHQTCV